LVSLDVPNWTSYIGAAICVVLAFAGFLYWQFVNQSVHQRDAAQRTQSDVALDQFVREFQQNLAQQVSY
jgi:hypothetical protein